MVWSAATPLLVDLPLAQPDSKRRDPRLGDLNTARERSTKRGVAVNLREIHA